MTEPAIRHAFVMTTMLLGVLVGCNARPEPIEPSIQFTTVPAAAAGGPERTTPIAAHVKTRR